MNHVYDAAVIGLGAAGSAAVYQLSKLGLSVIGIDAHAPPHDLGSHGGETRIVRQAIGEGVFYTPLALRSYEIWHELEQQSKQKLLYKVGGLVIAKKDNIFFSNTLEAAKKYKISHELFNNNQIKKRFSFFNIEDNVQAYYEHNAGYVIPEECIKVQLNLAKEMGANIVENEEVLNINHQKTHSIIQTKNKFYRANKIIIAIGSSLKQFLAPFLKPFFTISRQVLYWFDVDVKYYDDFQKSPIFIWQLNNIEGIYGFPAINSSHGGIKIATHNLETIENLSDLNRKVNQEEKNNFYERFIKPNFFYIKNNCLRAQVCTYISTPDENFVIDHVPEHENILLVSACSGHGFKHSAAVGEIAALWVIDQKRLAHLSHFSWQRFS